MVEQLHTVAGEPTTVFERPAGVVEIHNLHPREVAIISLEMPPAGLKDGIRDALVELGEVIREAGVVFGGPPFARYIEWTPEWIVAEVGVPVLRPTPHVGRVQPGRLPGGTVASIIHIGPYERIAETYARLAQWLEATGRGEMGSMWEVYWSDPAAEPDPATWRTEIVHPLR